MVVEHGTVKPAAANSRPANYWSKKSEKEIPIEDDSNTVGSSSVQGINHSADLLSSFCLTTAERVIVKAAVATSRSEKYWSRRFQKDPPPPLHHVEDEELQEQLLTAWVNDREKKRARQLQREEDRRLGRIGEWDFSENVEINLVDKYPTGMTGKDVLREVELFCAGVEERYTCILVL
jgi:hypothetical protein